VSFNELKVLTQQKTSPSVGSLLRRSKKTVLLIIVVAAVTLLVSAAVSIILEHGSSITLPSIGNIHTIGVKAYWDSNLKNQTIAIDWGTVYAGQSYNVTLYLQSISNVPTVLEMTATNWTFIDANSTIAPGPTDSTPYVNLTWNCNNQTLNPNETIPTTFTLTTDNSFDFITFLINNNIKQVAMDITIQANEK
jgi:hypothetical protein